MSHTIDPTQVAWRTSTLSTDAGAQCVEAGPVNDSSNRVAIRHSHHPEAQLLACTRAEWATFITDVKAGHLDI